MLARSADEVKIAELKAAGKIAPHVKFQVDLVPAHSVIWLFVEEDLVAERIAFEPALDGRLMEALQDLPAEGRAEVLRYLRFKVLETFGSSPRAERYLRAIDSAGDLKVTTAPDDPFHGGGT